MQKTVWAELAVQVETIRVYAANHATAFRLMVELVASTRDLDPRDPATARVKTIQAAATSLREFGLTPASQDRVSANPAALALPEPSGDWALEDDVPLFGPALHLVNGAPGPRDAS